MPFSFVKYHYIMEEKDQWRFGYHGTLDEPVDLLIDCGRVFHILDSETRKLCYFVSSINYLYS